MNVANVLVRSRGAVTRDAWSGQRLQRVMARLWHDRERIEVFPLTVGEAVKRVSVSRPACAGSTGELRHRDHQQDGVTGDHRRRHRMADGLAQRQLPDMATGGRRQAAAVAKGDEPGDAEDDGGGDLERTGDPRQRAQAVGADERVAEPGPRGKELAAETLRAAGHLYQTVVESVIESSPDIVSGVRNCFQGAAEVLRMSDYADACPVATVALEVASSDEPLRVVTATIFAGWLASITARFEGAGIEPERARRLGTLFVAALEGGFLLSRVAKDARAMETIGGFVVELVEAALEP